MPNRNIETDKTFIASFEELKKSSGQQGVAQLGLTMQLSQLKLALDLANAAMQSGLR